MHVVVVSCRPTFCFSLCVSLWDYLWDMWR
jgi:hypothetical protein